MLYSLNILNTTYFREYKQKKTFRSFFFFFFSLLLGSQIKAQAGLDTVDESSKEGKEIGMIK